MKKTITSYGKLSKTDDSNGATAVDIQVHLPY